MPMEAKDIFEANSKNVRELLSERGLGLYIPAYQRPYGLDKDKVLKLVADTFHGYCELLKSEESYTFLGTVITIHDINFTTVQPVVRPDVPAKVLTVIDGQQRLTTLLALCIALHNQIRLAHAKLLKGKKSDSMSGADVWLDGQARKVNHELESTFVEKQVFGDSPLYPRMIRSFDDQWSRSKATAIYFSPIAHLLATYAGTLDDSKPTDFRPTKRDGSIEGEEALVDRVNQISKLLKNLNSGSEDIEDLPQLSSIASESKLQRALLNHDFPDEVRTILLTKAASADFERLLQLVLLASYTLGRVALTVVRGKNEDYAFTIFESLNTTGEPLTAYETFKPRVVMAETLEKFESSKSREYLNHVSDYLSSFKVGEPLQNATRDLLISFACAETGFKLSKRLADQRKYLNEEFERYEANPKTRMEFVQHLCDVADFTSSAWGAKDSHPSLPGLPVEATTDAVKLCLAFLYSLNHSVTIAPMVRYYSRAVWTAESHKARYSKDLEGAIKALAAFSALWRASRRGTANIDQQYREMLAGNNERTTKMPALARSLRKDAKVGTASPVVDLELLKAELRARLAHPEIGGIDTQDAFIREAALVPAYLNGRDVARFILLAAYHDSIADPAGNGLIVKGKPAVSPCLTYDGYRDDRNFSLEHIAPQDSASQWAADIYTNKEVVHRIGNLVLIPGLENKSLSSRPWEQKKVLYRALGASSHADATKILADATSNDGIEFVDSTQDIVSRSKHLPQVSAIGSHAGPWDAAFIEIRSKRLLGMAWNELYKWLE